MGDGTNVLKRRAPKRHLGSLMDELFPDDEEQDSDDDEPLWKMQRRVI